MPLNPLTLKNEIKKVCDKASSGEEVSFIDMIGAVNTYILEMQYPPPVGASSGIQTMKSVMGSVTFQISSAAPSLFDSAFVQLGIALSSAVPIGSSLVFPTIPPIGTPGLKSVFSNTQNAEIFATNFSTKVDTWIRTGQYDAFGIPAAPPAPPVPVPTPWT
tara:strand:- start:74 stop:556 length:483 start_codon:yes stop_codon:yes gene_type:complete